MHNCKCGKAKEKIRGIFQCPDEDCRFAQRARRTREESRIVPPGTELKRQQKPLGLVVDLVPSSAATTRTSEPTRWREPYNPRAHHSARGGGYHW